MPFDLKPTQKKENFIPTEDPYRGEYFEDYKNDAEHKLPSEIGKILHHWTGPEFEVYEKSKLWYVIALMFILAVLAYALLKNSPIMAITFILIGIVGYIYSQKDPRIVKFAITSKGIFADKELYLYENIISFWIFYEPGYTKTISLHTKASTFPFVHIPIGDEDPVKIREILIGYIEEIKQDPSLIDTIEKILHI